MHISIFSHATKLIVGQSVTFLCPAAFETENDVQDAWSGPRVDRNSQNSALTLSEITLLISGWTLYVYNTSSITTVVNGALSFVYSSHITDDHVPMLMYSNYSKSTYSSSTHGCHQQKSKLPCTCWN